MADENNTGWKIYRPEWYNDRVMETYISAPIVDKQGDMVPTETIKDAMDFYMRYGVYSYRHEEMPIGLPLAYKVKDGKVKIRIGIHNKIAMHDKVWKEIKDFGPSGASSIRGEATNQEKVCESENDCHTRINELSLWSVSWVGDNPANPEAKVTDVSMAKSNSVQVTLDEVEAMVEKIIERKNGKYCLYAKKDRKLLGCHDTKEGAIRQERAIQARRYSKSDVLGEILTKIEKYKIPSGVKKEAKYGRELRKKHGYGGGNVTKTINRHLIDKDYVNYKMAMSIHKYYRRHENVDPQGKNFNNKKRPSKGYIMWKMMGGDAGHSWSKGLQDKVKAAPCWSGFEMVGFKNEGGKRVPNCVPVSKSRHPQTPAKPSERRRGSDKNPKGSAGGQRGGIKLSEANIKTLKNYIKEHNEKVGDAKGKKANLGALKAVFRRGAGAYSTSHRPSVQSRDQWALGRVKAFLRLLSSGKPSNPKYTTDYDLLPAEHPKSTKKSKEETVKVDPPKGYHWMQTREGPVLMEGDYEPHEGAVEAFPFTVLETHEDERIIKAEYQGRKVELNKPRRLSGENKKFGVYVKNDKGNVVQVKFGDPNMDIKRDDPEKRRQFRARHNCDNPGPKHKARYWSCKMWSSKNVSDITKAECPCVIKTERLQKTNEHLDDIMRMIKFGLVISKDKDDDKKVPPPSAGQNPPKAWFENCRMAARRISNDKDPFGGPRGTIRDNKAWCSELWYNPGKFSQTYNKPDGSKGRTDGYKLRRMVGDASWRPD